MLTPENSPKMHSTDLNALDYHKLMQDKSGINGTPTTNRSQETLRQTKQLERQVPR